VPPNYFENVMNRTLCTVLFMAYPQGVPQNKKGWPSLLYTSISQIFLIRDTLKNSKFIKFNGIPENPSWHTYVARHTI
jgi:hypothetical protein